MAALPADFCKTVTGGRIVASAAPGPATYLPDGTRLVYIADADETLTTAIDAEPRGVPLPAVVARALVGLEDEAAQRVWTSLEVIAKLTDTPILIVLRGVPQNTLNRLDASVASVRWKHHGIEVERYDTDDIWLVLGRLLSGN